MGSAQAIRQMALLAAALASATYCAVAGVGLTEIAASAGSAAWLSLGEVLVTAAAFRAASVMALRAESTGAPGRRSAARWGALELVLMLILAAQALMFVGLLNHWFSATLQTALLWGALVVVSLPTAAVVLLITTVAVARWLPRFGIGVLVFIPALLAACAVAAVRAFGLEDTALMTPVFMLGVLINAVAGHRYLGAFLVARGLSAG